jgi:hypothetical protein
MSIIRREQLVTPLSASYAATASIATSASYAATASYAENAGVSIDTGSLVTTSSFNAYTASINSFTSSINAFTASYNTGSFTGSFTGNFIGTSSWAVSASQAISSSYYQETDPVFVAKSASLATTGSNTFIGNQIVTGSLVVTNNFTVLGSASIQYISESTLNIGTNLITVNTNTPSVRFGGLAVIDSGSSPLTSASFLYDALQDEFIFVHKGDGTNITSSHFVLGPETYNDLGNETYLTANRIPKGKGNEHLNDSNISDNGSLVSINSNTNITGSLLLSGSSLIVSSSILQMPNNIIINSTTRRLNSGSILSVDWGNRSLHNDSNVTTVNWNSSYLLNSLGTTVDWGNYGLVDSIGNYSLGWASRMLNTLSGVEALNWENDYVNYSNTYLYRFHDITSQDALVSSVQYTGETINAAVSSSATQYNLVALSGSYWLPVSQTTDTSTKMLGIALNVNTNPTKGIVLLEGDISFDGTDGPSIHPGLTPGDNGKPVYIRNNAVDGDLSIVPPGNGYIRIVGHVYYNNGTGYIFKFKPSNDWYKLS